MKRVINLDALHPDSCCVHGGMYQDAQFNSVAPPLYPSSTFYFEAPGVTSGFDYARTANPTRQALETNLARLEGGAGCTATGSGMAAITLVLHMLEAGAHVIAGHDIYGGTYRLFADYLPRRSLEFSFVDLGDADALAAAWRPNTRLLWIETPSNPLLNVLDIQALCAAARARDVRTLVDNTFLTPMLQRPLALGADLALHSTTKYINGHSDVLGGAVIAADAEVAETVARTANALGTTASAHDAWLILRGVRTLALRMERHESNAAALARWLDAHRAVDRVYYPGLPSHPGHELARRQQSGFGGMLSFDLRGGQAACEQLLRSVRLFSVAESLGGVESLIEHPATMSHAAMTEQALRTAGIGAGTLRISAGIEHPEDLIADLERGLPRD